MENNFCLFETGSIVLCNSIFVGRAAPQFLWVRAQCHLKILSAKILVVSFRFQPLKPSLSGNSVYDLTQYVQAIFFNNEL